MQQGEKLVHWSNAETKTKNRDGKFFVLDLCLNVLLFTLDFIFYPIPTIAVCVMMKTFFVAETKKNFIFNVSYKLLKQTVSDR